MSVKIERGADISDCGNYRHRLWRIWDDNLPLALWIMLNPSTADGTRDDPTIRRCTGFTKSWGGFGGYIVCNLFDWRATNPRNIEHVSWASSSCNEAFLQEEHRASAITIAAWGSCSTKLRVQRAGYVAFKLATIKPLHCLATTTKGDPRHPLMLAGGLTPQPWEPSR